MPSTALESMGIDLESATRRATFLSDFGAMRREEAASAEGERRRILDLESATCLLEAAQWLMATEPSAALDLLDDAGRIYTAHEHSFGLFLRVLADATDPVLPVEIRAHLSHLRSRADFRDSPAAMTHPQQHAYALLAAAGHEEVAASDANALSEVAMSSPHRNGAVPVGALGLPIRHFWALALAIMGVSDHSGQTQDLSGVTTLAAFVRQHMLVCGSARTVPRLWRHGAADVHPVDLDTVALFSLLCRHREPAELAESVRAHLPELDVTDVTIIEIAREFTEATRTTGR